jgi:hypothetical protein
VDWGRNGRFARTLAEDMLERLGFAWDNDLEKKLEAVMTQPPKTVPPTMCEFSETGEAGRLVKKGGMVEVYFFEEWVVLEVKQVGNRRS